MKILDIKTGSSSLKYQFLYMEHETVMESGEIERIGDKNSLVTHRKFPGQDREEKVVINRSVADHNEGLHLSIGLIVDKNISARTALSLERLIRLSSPPG